VGRLGFDIDDKAVKRAGLDYWENLDLKTHKTHEELLKNIADPQRVFYFSKKASKNLFEVEFKKGDCLVFGRETTGLDEGLLRQVESKTVRIPMWGPIRSLNLSNAVTVAIYEAMRQTNSTK
jgi:tRNA (cytidine/uridine-2'-O-)-methyltransferase